MSSNCLIGFHAKFLNYPVGFQKKGGEYGSMQELWD